MLYDSTAWQWGPGICTKHRGQTLPCGVCIEGHDPDLVKSEAQILDVEVGTSKILSVTNVETQRSGKPIQTMSDEALREQHDKDVQAKRTMSPLDADHFELEHEKKKKWAASLLETVLKMIPLENRHEARTGFSYSSTTHYVGPWDNAKTWADYIAELQKVVDEPIRQPVTLTCVKPNQLPEQMLPMRTEGIEPHFQFAFMGRKAGSGIPLTKVTTVEKWNSGESVDLFFNLPLQVKGAVQDVHRMFPKTRLSVLVRAANLTFNGMTVTSLSVPIEPCERAAVDFVCSLTCLWEKIYTHLRTTD